MRLAKQDQKERKRFFDNPDKVTKNDHARRAAVSALLARNRIQTARDYFNAALIFQHGLTKRDYRRAQSLAHISVEKGGGEQARWLFAVTTDRYLTAQGRKQKFGTQFNIATKIDQRTGRQRREMRLLPYDKRTSDAIRIQHGLPSLKDLLKMDGRPPPKRQKRIAFRLS
jgi:hypothetical protein